MKSFIAFFIFSIFLVSIVSAQQLPKPINYASDFANVIDPEREAAINALGESLEANTSSQIFVATIQNTDKYTAKEYATALFNNWKIGQKGKDNGILILLAFEPEKRTEVEVGYGLEGLLPDSKVGRIRREYTPLLTEGKYGEGLFKMAKSMSDVVQGSGEFSAEDSGDTFGSVFGIIFFAIWIIIFASIFAGLGNRKPKCPNCKNKMDLVKETTIGDYTTSEFVCLKCGKKISKKRRKSSNWGGLVVLGSGGWGSSGGGGFGGGGGGSSGGGGSGGGF